VRTHEGIVASEAPQQAAGGLEDPDYGEAGAHQEDEEEDNGGGRAGDSLEPYFKYREAR
jgi:hypothetical protein